MFESVFKSSERLEAEAAEGRSPEEIAGLRLAAILLVANVFLVLLSSFVLRPERIPLFNIIVALVVARQLYWLRPRAEMLALGLALLAAVAAPVLFFLNLPALEALFESIALWGATTPLFLLLLGRPSYTRRVIAVVVFCLFRVGPCVVSAVAELLL